jgi:hypothetical protein
MADPTALLNVIDGIVEELKTEGRVVDAVALANHLVITYSQSGMSKDEVVRTIERSAVVKGVPLLSGNKTAAIGVSI